MASRHRGLVGLVVLLIVVVAMVLCAPVADGDVGNVGGVAPGLCEYPSVCTSGAAFGEYDYSETWPTEVNGSHRQCLLGGAMYSGTAGASAIFFNVSVTSPLGVIRGACWYACPDPWLSDAGFPNPPGSWKSYLVPKKCEPIGPAPIPINPPPPADAPPPPPPPGLPVLAPFAPAPLIPSVTTPIAPDPLGTENSGK